MLEYNNDLVTKTNELRQELVQGSKRPTRVFNIHVVVTDLILVVRELHLLMHLADMRPSQAHTLMCGLLQMIKDYVGKYNTEEAERARKETMKVGCNTYTKRDHAFTNQFLNGLKIAVDEEDGSTWQIGIRTLPESILGLTVFNHPYRLFMTQAAASRPTQPQPVVETPSATSQAEAGEEPRITEFLGESAQSAPSQEANALAKPMNPLGLVQRGLRGTLQLTAPPPPPPEERSLSCVPPPKCLGTDDIIIEKVVRRPDQNPEMYPEGYFDDKVHEHFGNGFIKHFNEAWKKGYTPFSGVDDSFPTLWTKFHQQVHLRPDKTVSPLLKLMVLSTVMEPGSPADKIVQKYLGWHKPALAYEKAIMALHLAYNKDVHLLRMKIYTRITKLAPVGKSAKDICNYVDTMEKLYIDAVNCRADEDEAGLTFIEQMTQTLEEHAEPVLDKYLVNNKIMLEEKHTWYRNRKERPSDTWEQFAAGILRVLASRLNKQLSAKKAEEAMAELGQERKRLYLDKTAMLHVAGQPQFQLSAEEREEALEDSLRECDEHEYSAQIGGNIYHGHSENAIYKLMQQVSSPCIFCGGSHSMYHCEMSNWDKYGVIKRGGKYCPNCFGLACVQRGYCEKPFHCWQCKDNPKKGPHHKLVCIDLSNPANAEMLKRVQERQEKQKRDKAAAANASALPATTVKVEVKQGEGKERSIARKTKRDPSTVVDKKTKVFLMANQDPAEQEVLDNFAQGAAEVKREQGNEGAGPA